MRHYRSLVTGSALAMGAAALLATTLPALAQGAQEARAERLFERLDADDSGTVSLEEFTARAKARFEELDADGDGALSVEEAQELGPDRDRGRGDRQGRGGMQGRMDGAQMGPGYGMGQGYGMGPGGCMRSGQGMGQGCGMGQGYGMGPGRGMGQGMGPRGGGYGMFGGLQGDGPMGYGGFGDPTLSDEDRAARAAQLVEMLDADGDGKLSPDEMAARPGPEMIFNRVDADGDGAISREEFDAAVERFGGRFGAGRGTR